VLDDDDELVIHSITFTPNQNTTNPLLLKDNNPYLWLVGINSIPCEIAQNDISGEEFAAFTTKVANEAFPSNR
jgi:hypothetical protein